MKDKQIEIFHDIEIQDEHALRGEESTKANRTSSSVALSKLTENIEDFYQSASSIFSKVQSQKGSNGFSLDEITINAEIGVDGKIGFMGTGVGGSSKAGISFKLKRK